MASQLSEIIAAIAALTVTVSDSIAYAGDKTPQVLYLSTLPNGAPDAKLPARLVQMLTEQDAGAPNMEIVFGNETIARVSWRIYDRLLWRKLSQGQSVGSHEADLVKYCAAYVEALKTIPAPSTRSTIGKATLTVREINYPVGSDFWYAGVEAALDVDERLAGTAPTPWA